MPPGSIEYFYSIRSSFTYLGAQRLTGLARKHDLTVRHYPMDLRQLVDALSPIGSAHPAGRPHAGARVLEASPVRERYTRIEYERWGRHLGIAINPGPTHHYGPRELPSGAVIVAQRRGLDADAVSHALLQGLWRDDRDIADIRVVSDILDGLHLDVASSAICEEAMSQAVQQEQAENTLLAAQKGGFGAPTYIYSGEPFFGQDRLDFLERAITG